MTALVFRDDSYARSCVARVLASDARGIRLDRTVFYPTGGGQPGDTGVLRLASGATIAIADTVKGEGPDEVIHVPAPGAALPEPGAEVTAEIGPVAITKIESKGRQNRRVIVAFAS